MRFLLANIELPDQFGRWVLKRKIADCVREGGLGAHGIYLAGMIISQGWMFEEVGQALRVLFPVGLIVICLTVYALFHRLSVVVATTFIGFMSLMAIPAPSTRHLALALAAAIGVAGALLLASTLVPIAFSFLPPLPGDRDTRLLQISNGLLQSIIGVCRHLSMKFSWLIIFACALLLAVLADLLLLPAMIRVGFID